MCESLLFCRSENVNLDDVLTHLRTLNEPVLRTMRLPSEAEVRQAEESLNRKFHPDYRKFLLTASDVIYGTLEPATLTAPDSHTDLLSVCDDAWRGYGMPQELLPICEDNSDFFCINERGEVVSWSHNGTSNERWPDLATWIIEVWLRDE